MLPVVLYGCETWSVILREEQGLGVFEKGVLREIFGVLREIFGPKGEEVTHDTIK